VSVGLGDVTNEEEPALSDRELAWGVIILHEDGTAPTE
jgi:hypothetical protein